VTIGAVSGSSSAPIRSTPASRSSELTSSNASRMRSRGSGYPGDEIDGMATSRSRSARRPGINSATARLAGPS
jgi:hypothetical protein